MFMTLNGPPHDCGRWGFAGAYDGKFSSCAEKDKSLCGREIIVGRLAVKYVIIWEKVALNVQRTWRKLYS